jgi:hypothetical protein
MNLFQLYELLHIAANKDVMSGWFTPEQYQNELLSKNIRLMRDKMGLPERYRPGMFASGSGATRMIETDLVPFYVDAPQTITSQESNISDWYYINSFYTADSVFPEIISNQELANRIKHPTKTPNTEYPAAIVVKKGLKIWPASVTRANIIYYRKPKDPKFVTSVNADGELIYNAANSVELEWRDDCKIDIIHLIMEDLGVNIERPDLEQLASKLVEGGK